MTEWERLNSSSHLVGAVLALAGMAGLLARLVSDFDAWHAVAFGVYGVSLFLLYLISTLYHHASGRSRRLLRLLDHQAIYLLIAGTYTPFTLITLRGSVGWWLFGAIWGMALLGIVLYV